MSESTNLPSAVVSGGDYRIMTDFDGQSRAHAFVRQCFFDAIETMLGSQTRARVQAAGLSALHEYVSADEAAVIKSIVHPRIKPQIHSLAYRVGCHELGIQDEFWISDAVFTRIHFPFTASRQLEPAHAQSRPTAGKLRPCAEPRMAVTLVWRKAYSSLEFAHKTVRLFNLPIVVRNIAPFVANRVNEFEYWLTHRKRMTRTVPGTETSAVHGPHLDLWNGMPFDGITLWWAIDNVSAEGGLILYPQLFGVIVKRNIETPAGQAQLGIVFPEPTKISLRSGQLLVFSQDKMLHASHVNVSGYTRVVVSTHLCLERPTFSPETRFAFEGFFSSKDIARGELKLQRFRFSKNHASVARRPAQARPPHPEGPATIRRRFKLERGVPVAICASSQVPDGSKVLVLFDNDQVILSRVAGRVFGFSALCPHRNFNLVHGAHRAHTVFCPGHGLSFDIRDGKSTCDALSLRTFATCDEHGEVIITG